MQQNTDQKDRNLCLMLQSQLLSCPLPPPLSPPYFSLLLPSLCLSMPLYYVESIDIFCIRLVQQVSPCLPSNLGVSYLQSLCRLLPPNLRFSLFHPLSNPSPSCVCFFSLPSIPSLASLSLLSTFYFHSKLFQQPYNKYPTRVLRLSDSLRRRF